MSDNTSALRLCWKTRLFYNAATPANDRNRMCHRQ